MDNKNVNKNFKWYASDIAFPPSFFEPEEREGFYVSGMMKRYWAAQIYVLAKVAGVCEKYNIRWFADCGTLIGTVRHGGYIPWDDDLDICMMREDFELFARIAEKELPKEYNLRSIRTDAEHEDIIMRVINNESIVFSDEHLREYYGCPYVVGIDIFPLDGLYEDEEKEEERCNRIKAIEEAVSLMAAGEYSSLKCKKLLLDIERQNKTVLHRDKNIVEELLMLSERIYSECPTKGASHVALMNYWVQKKNHKYPKELFDNTVYIPFENICMPVPARYDEVLKIEYGDYMHVYKGGGCHEYPCYKAQEEVLRQNIGRNPYRYTFEQEKFRVVCAEQRVSVRDRCSRILDTISKAHNSLDMLIEQGRGELAGQLLERCQTMAITLGTTLEKRGEGSKEAVHLLEQYCELLYQCTENWQGSSALVDMMHRIENEVKSVLSTTKIVFLPSRADRWPLMRDMWATVSGEEDTEVYVIPIPYYERNAEGDLGQKHDELRLFPNDVMVTDAGQFDFTKEYPDIIVIDQPYDSWNLGSSVPDFFFSENLRKYTDKLIYFSCFDLNAPVSEEDKANVAIEIYVEQPALIYADEVWVKSDELRGAYIDDLLRLTGAQNREYWEQKIVSIKSGNFEAAEKKRQKSDKPILLFYTTISFLLMYGDDAIKSIRRALKTITEAEDISCVWYIDEPATFLKDIDSGLWNLLKEIVNQYSDGQIDIYDTDEDLEKMLEKCSAFYGNPGRVAHWCRNRGIPVMLQSADCE